MFLLQENKTRLFAIDAAANEPRRLALAEEIKAASEKVRIASDNIKKRNDELGKKVRPVRIFHLNG